MRGIVRPSAAQARVEIVKSIAMEEIAVQQDSSAEPIRAPSPAEAAPQSPAAAEIETKIDPG
jgi:hypothetical protein